MKQSTVRKFTSVYGQMNTDGKNGIYCKKTYLYEDIPVHNHNHYEIEVCLNGHGEQWLNGNSYKISAGDSVILATTDIHQIHIEKSPLVLFSIRMNMPKLPHDIRKVLMASPTPQIGHFTLHELNGYIQTYEALEAAINSDNPLSFLEVQGNMLLLMSELFHSFTAADTQINRFGKHDYIDNAIRYINEHYAEQLKLSDIATAINISPNYLSELFFKDTGIHISDYLTQVRVLYSQSMLENTELNITDIASAVGFNSFSSFSRSFKRICGIAPSAYLQTKRKTK